MSSDNVQGEPSWEFHIWGVVHSVVGMHVSYSYAVLARLTICRLTFVGNVCMKLRCLSYREQNVWHLYKPFG